VAELGGEGLPWSARRGRAGRRASRCAGRVQEDGGWLLRPWPTGEGVPRCRRARAIDLVPLGGTHPALLESTTVTGSVGSRPSRRRLPASR